MLATFHQPSSPPACGGQLGWKRSQKERAQSSHFSLCCTLTWPEMMRTILDRRSLGGWQNLKHYQQTNDPSTPNKPHIGVPNSQCFSWSDTAGCGRRCRFHEWRQFHTVSGNKAIFTNVPAISSHILWMCACSNLSLEITHSQICSRFCSDATVPVVAERQ